MTEWVLVLSVVLASGDQHHVDIGPLPGWGCSTLVEALPVKAVRAPVGTVRVECKLRKE